MTEERVLRVKLKFAEDGRVDFRLEVCEGGGTRGIAIHRLNLDPPPYTNVFPHDLARAHVLRPRWAIFENVRNALGSVQFGGTAPSWSRIELHLEEGGVTRIIPVTPTEAE